MSKCSFTILVDRLARLLDPFSLKQKPKSSISTEHVGKQVRAALVIVGSLLFLVGCAVEQDKEEARLIAARVHDELRTGDFGSIYSESAPRFKTVGNELQFVERMKAFQEQFGQLNSASE